MGPWNLGRTTASLNAVDWRGLLTGSDNNKKKGYCLKSFISVMLGSLLIFNFLKYVILKF